MRVFPSASSSVITRADGSVMQTRHRNIERNGRVLLHGVAYTPDAEGSIVPRAVGARPAAPLATTPPPDDSDFLNGALMVLVSGDDCLLCSDGLQIGAFRHYVHQLSRTAGFPPATQRFDFTAVANRDNIKELIESGVQEVA